MLASIYSIEKSLLTSNSANLESSTNLCGQSSLSSTEDNIDELLRGRHRRNLCKKIVSVESRDNDFSMLTSFQVVFMVTVWLQRT